MANLEIKSADEFIALELDRWKTRRAARETEISRHILRTFVDHGGPIPVDAILAALPDRAADPVHQALVALDDDDLIRIRDGHVDVAYPFSASPTAFVVRLPDGAERYACCAMDALGIAPMLGQRIAVRSHCHHCRAPLQFPVSPDGPETEGVMLWIGKRADDRGKVADSL